MLRAIVAIYRTASELGKGTSRTIQGIRIYQDVRDLSWVRRRVLDQVITTACEQSLQLQIDGQSDF
jgi:hypothetical protein